MTVIPECGVHQDRARAGKGFTRKSAHQSPEPLFDLPPERIPHPNGNGYLPDWLVGEIHASPGPRFRTHATWTRCPRCQAIILTGLDDPVIADAATVDPSPLTALQELICALENRPTYLLVLMGATGRIVARHKWQHPAGTAGKHPVVPAHNCKHRFPGFIPPPAPERPTHDHPPF